MATMATIVLMWLHGYWLLVHVNVLGRVHVTQSVEIIYFVLCISSNGAENIV